MDMIYRDKRGANTLTATVIAILTVLNSQQSINCLVAPVSGLAQTAGPAKSPSSGANYFGSLIGKLDGRRNNVSGDVYAVDEQTIFIRNFNYDGLAPDAYFWSSVSSQQPSGQEAFIVPDEKGSTKPLERYQDKDVVLRLPEGKTLREINWLSIWSRKMQQNLGEISLLKREPQLITPRPLEIGPLSQLAHNVRSGPITIVDAQTFLIPDLHYDGLGPAAYFWLTRGSQGLSQNGLRLKDENGFSGALKKYSGETVVISLPDDLTIYDFDYFGIWCKEFQVNFGQVRIPKSARVPPSPKMLGIKPENKLNCEILYDDLGYEIRWVLDGDDIVMQLVGKIDSNEYMAFGLGKDDSKSEMANADAVVTWVDRQTGQVHAVDYFLGGKAQCINDQSVNASCPDNKLPAGGDSLTLLHGAIVNGYSMVTFKRPQLGIDELYDQHVYSDGQQSVIWAIGQLNKQQEIGYHRLRTRGNMFIDFARNPQWNCPIPDLNATMNSNSISINLPNINSAASQVDPIEVAAQPASEVPARPQQQQSPPSPLVATASTTRTQPIVGDRRPTELVALDKQPGEHQASWFIPQIVCPKDRTLYVQIGPAGGRRAFEAQTGHQSSSGVVWYVNGLLAPELILERGSVYKFVIEGGNDKTSLTRRHPFYLTDNPDGGFDFKLDEERLKERIFAGVALRGDGQFVPTAEGRLCEWKPSNETKLPADQYNSFAAYQRTLKLDCLAGQAAVLKFAPDAQTPDSLYYQCYTHRNMGWKIRVVNSCSVYVQNSIQLLQQAQQQRNNNNKKKTNNLTTTRSDPQDSISINKRSTDASARGPKSQAEARIGEFDQSSMDSFNDHLTSSSNNQYIPEMFSNSLGSQNSFPRDMIILNNSQLLNANLSSTLFEDLIKLPPSDLSFLDQQQPSQADMLFFQPQASASYHQRTIPLPVQLVNQQPILTQQNKTSPSSSGTQKTPKTLHSYMRRLASIYYPVQQQLNSIFSTSQSKQQQQKGSKQVGSNSLQSQVTSGSSSNANNGLDLLTAAGAASSNHFSAANLVPISKIDLSKATISKKLNKFRFKSGRKYEPQQNKLSQPPASAIEFNYDIFNNQLEQMKKQQNSIENGGLHFNEPQSGSSNSFNYLPLVANDDSGDLDEQQQMSDSLNLQATQTILGNMLSQQYHKQSFNSGPTYVNWQQQQHQPQQSQQYPQRPQTTANTRQPVRFSETPLGPPNQLGQQPYLVDYLSMGFNRSFSSPSGPSQQSQGQQYKQQHMSEVVQQPNSQQHSIFITRVPQPFHFYPKQAENGPTWSHFQHKHQEQQPLHQTQTSVKYPSIQPYSGQQQQVRSPAEGEQTYQSQQQQSQPQQMSPLPSVTLSVHDNFNRNQEREQEGIQDGQPHEVESLSLSGSGSHYDFRQQPTKQQQQTKSEDLQMQDHMLAIERFSKQSSERRPPLIADPITGVQIVGNYFANNRSGASSENLENHESGSGIKFSNPLIDKNTPAPTGRGAGNSNDLMEVEPTTQLNDLQRLQQFNGTKVQRTGSLNNMSLKNGAGSQIVCAGQDVACSQSAPAPTTTESIPVSLVRPQLSNNESDHQRPPAVAAPLAGSLVSNFGPATTIPSGPSSLNSLFEDTISGITELPFFQNQLARLQNGLQTVGQTGPQLQNFNFDPDPFTPIELIQNQFRIRQPSLIESMISQQSIVTKPEPPVQVASNLAQKLSAAASSIDQLVPLNEVGSISLPASGSSVQTANGAPNYLERDQTGRSSSKPGLNSDLIILKPALLTAKQRPQTYALKAEFLTSKENPSEVAQVQLNGPAGEENQGRKSTEFLPFGKTQNKRPVGGHLFDRLSSLSSPPSTSISLMMDPMQASNTNIQVRKQPNSEIGSILAEAMPAVGGRQINYNIDQTGNATGVASEQNSSANLNKSSASISNEFSQPSNRQHQPPSKQLLSASVKMPEQSGELEERIRIAPGGDNANNFNLLRDNQTDNAILSHVMSLISSNAIPTPPIIPVASYSSADYFMPMSDSRIYQRSIRG